MGWCSSRRAVIEKKLGRDPMSGDLFFFVSGRDDLIECGCNMHARRRLTAALDAGDARAALPIAAYKQLYEVEAKARDGTAEARLAIRQAESKPVWERALRLVQHVLAT